MPDTELRRYLRDVVALTSLSAVWTGRDPGTIARSLAHVLRTNLRLEVAAVRGSRGAFRAVASREDAAVDDKAVDSLFTLAADSRGDGAEWGGAPVRAASAPLGYGADYGEVVVASRDAAFPSELDRMLLSVAVNQATMAIQAHALLESEKVQRARVERLSELGLCISAELGRDKLLQAIIDAATELSDAKFGAFFYNVADDQGDSHMLYAISGATRESFAGLRPSATSFFGAAFCREGVVRIGDVRNDPRYGQDAPYYEMPAGHLPVVSYLAVPVLSRSGEVLGGLFFGHPEPDRFDAGHERIVCALAAHAAVTLDNVRLFEAAERSRREVQEQHEHITSILESIDDGFLAVDREWRLTFVNQRALEITRRPRPQLLRESVLELFPEAGVVLRRAMARREPAYLEIRETEQDRWLEMDACPAGDGLVLLMRDITEKKSLEEKLRQTQKLESLGVLAGGVAHDFNNLLTGILGNASLLLEDEPPNSAGAPLLAEVVLAAERAAHLTQQLLAYAGKGRFVVAPMSLSDMVRDISKLLRSSIPKNAQVDLNLQPDLAPVMADRAQMQQLVMNLVINGAEAIPGGHPGVVTVTTGIHTVHENRRESYSHGEIGPGSYVRLEVWDSGVGMDEHTLARIFDPFFTTKFTGRGLGLAAALGIVRGHGGALHVRSTPGGGSVFQVFLPALVAAETPRVEPERFPSTTPLLGTVLVIDDEDVIRKTATSVLERCGCAVLTASSGWEGLEVYRRHASELSLVILDLTMPDMGGEEALHRLKAIHDGVCVLLSSGYDESEIMRQFAGQPLAGFLQKPYSAASLARKVTDLLGAGRPARPSGAA
jgi:signal transduction histidine kinase/CheY-like chemotaxis protein